MSESYFPTLTGLAPEVTRETIYRTSIYETPGGSEQRVSWMASPRYRFQLKANVLQDSLSERAALVTLHEASLGAADSFWFLDPVDSKVRKVRFSEDGLSLARIVPGLWEAGWDLITVSAVTLDSIAVTPTNQTTAHPGTRQFTCTGTLSSTATVVLTTTCTWASSATNRATIASTGLATTVSAGSTTISATFGPLTNSTTFTVT